MGSDCRSKLVQITSDSTMFHCYSFNAMKTSYLLLSQLIYILMVCSSITNVIIHILVGGLEHFSIQLGMSSSQLTKSYFSEG